MLESSSSCVGVHSLRRESVQSADRGRSATLNVPVSAALDRDCTHMGDYDQSTGQRAYKKWHLSKGRGRVRPQGGATRREDNIEERVVGCTGLTLRRQAGPSREKCGGAFA